MASDNVEVRSGTMPPESELEFSAVHIEPFLLTVPSGNLQPRPSGYSGPHSRIFPIHFLLAS